QPSSHTDGQTSASRGAAVRKARADRWSSSCSGLRARSMPASARKPEAALGDDVALDLVGAAAEAEVRRRPVHLLGQAVQGRARVVGAQLTVGPEELE